MQSALQADGPTSEHLAVQLERIAEALERIAVRRRRRDGLPDPARTAGIARGGGVGSRWAFRNHGIRAALARAAARHGASSSA